MIEAEIRAILEDLLGHVEEPLELDSFALVDLLERAERRLGVVLPASALRPEHFASVASIAALFASHRAEPCAS